VRRKVTVVTVVLLAIAVALAVFGPAKAGGKVTGRVVSPIDSQTLVLVIEPAQGLGVRADVKPDGAFEAIVPDGAQEPWLVVDTQRGALVQTRTIDPVKGDAFGPLGVWEADAQVRILGRRLRVDWAPIPLGRDGYPPRVRYSVLVCYARDDGQPGEATFPAEEPWLEMGDAGEDLFPFLNQRDPSKPEVEVIVRAFDPQDPRGPMWIGARFFWSVDTGAVRPWTKG
jgi:hypothetical protein